MRNSQSGRETGVGSWGGSDAWRMRPSERSALTWAGPASAPELSATTCVAIAGGECLASVSASDIVATAPILHGLAAAANVGKTLAAVDDHPPDVVVIDQPSTAQTVSKPHGPSGLVVRVHRWSS